jgi:hypothetical protein
VAVYYTSNTLIDAVRRRASLPKADSLYSDEDILAFATDEIYDDVLPLIRNSQEEYLIYTKKVLVQNGVQAYEIPERSVASELRDLYFEDSNGNIYEMTRILPDDKFDRRYLSRSVSQPYNFYMENNTVVLNEKINSPATGYLVMKFILRPSALVITDRVAKITDIDRTTGIITVSKIPSVFNMSLKYDFTKTRSPHNMLAMDVSAVGLNLISNQITFNVEDIPQNLAVGDRICIENESDIPQIPTEMHRLVIAKTVERVLEGIRDSEGLANAIRKTQQVERGMDDLMENRVTSAPLKIKNKTSFLRRRFRRRF